VEEVSGEFAGKAKFVKVDVEDAEDVAVNYGIYAVPTILFFKGGQPVDKLQGLVAKPKLVERVNSLLSG
jgi:thioredoxin-like negative regulator of GroEL